MVKKPTRGPHHISQTPPQPAKTSVPNTQPIPEPPEPNFVSQHSGPQYEAPSGIPPSSSALASSRAPPNTPLSSKELQTTATRSRQTHDRNPNDIGSSDHLVPDPYAKGAVKNSALSYDTHSKDPIKPSKLPADSRSRNTASNTAPYSTVANSTAPRPSTTASIPSYSNRPEDLTDGIHPVKKVPTSKSQESNPNNSVPASRSSHPKESLFNQRHHTARDPLPPLNSEHRPKVSAQVNHEPANVSDVRRRSDNSAPHSTQQHPSSLHSNDKQKYFTPPHDKHTHSTTAPKKSSQQPPRTKSPPKPIRPRKVSFWSDFCLVIPDPDAIEKNREYHETPELVRIESAKSAKSAVVPKSVKERWRGKKEKKARKVREEREARKAREEREVTKAREEREEREAIKAREEKEATKARDEARYMKDGGQHNNKDRGTTGKGDRRENTYRRGDNDERGGSYGPDSNYRRGGNDKLGDYNERGQENNDERRGTDGGAHERRGHDGRSGNDERRGINDEKRKSESSGSSAKKDRDDDRSREENPRLENSQTSHISGVEKKRERDRSRPGEQREKDPTSRKTDFVRGNRERSGPADMPGSGHQTRRDSGVGDEVDSRPSEVLAYRKDNLEGRDGRDGSRLDAEHKKASANTVKEVENAPPPKTKKNRRSFMGKMMKGRMLGNESADGDQRGLEDKLSGINDSGIGFETRKDPRAGATAVESNANKRAKEGRSDHQNGKRNTDQKSDLEPDQEVVNGQKERAYNVHPPRRGYDQNRSGDNGRENGSESRRGVVRENEKEEEEETMVDRGQDSKNKPKDNAAGGSKPFPRRDPVEARTKTLKPRRSGGHH
ncbi:hypothetical protein ACMFMG_002728 [Clarireedia jacksonii]